MGSDFESDCEADFGADFGADFDSDFEADFELDLEHDLEHDCDNNFASFFAFCFLTHGRSGDNGGSSFPLGEKYIPSVCGQACSGVSSKFVISSSQSLNNLFHYIRMINVKLTFFHFQRDTASLHIPVFVYLMFLYQMKKTDTETDYSV